MKKLQFQRKRKGKRNNEIFYLCKKHLEREIRKINPGMSEKEGHDLVYIKGLLIKYGFEYLPILDPTDGFKILDIEPSSITTIRRNMI